MQHLNVPLKYFYKEIAQMLFKKAFQGQMYDKVCRI